MLFPPLRRLFDSDDFLLETFASVFTKKFSDDVLSSPHKLWPYLQRIAENKVRDAKRKYLLGPVHCLHREVPWETLVSQDEPCTAALAPAELLLLKELVEDRLADLLEQVPSLLQEILLLLLAGQNTTEISAQLDLEPKRIHRSVQWLKRKLRN